MDSEDEDFLSDSSSVWNNSDDDEKSESDEEPISNVRLWCRLDDAVPQPTPPAFPFTGSPGLKTNIAGLKEPIDYFSLYFDDEIVDYIVIETNRFADQFLERNELTPSSRVQDWKETNSSEIRVFLAILLYEGVVQKPVEGWYWSKRSSICTPFISDLMPRKRFQLIMKFLHFSNNESYDERTHPQPKLKKIYEVFKLLCIKFQTVYTPEKCIAVDESLMPYQGKLGFKQYIPTKRARFGIKFYELCESNSGYIWNMIIYTGKDTPYEDEFSKFGMATRCVMTLTKDLLNKGYCLFLDNFYMSPELAELLIARRTDVCGTIRQTRKNLPPNFKFEKVSKGKMIAFQKGKMCLIKWQDKKTVCLMSTIHSNDMVAVVSKKPQKNPVLKPKVVVDYNMGMGGVDKADQCMAYYPSIRNQQRKYYKKIFRHLLDQAVWNSFVLYKKDGGSMKLVDFRVELFEGLIKRYKTNDYVSKSVGKIPNILRLTERHFPSYVEATPKNKRNSRRCAVCANTFDENGRRKRKETRYQCKNCDVGLCAAPCFEIYHTVENF